MVNLNKKTGFIGAGNMAEAIIGAITRTGVIPSSMVYASDVNAERLNMLKKSYGISGVADNIKTFFNMRYNSTCCKAPADGRCFTAVNKSERVQCAAQKAGNIDSGRSASRQT